MNCPIYDSNEMIVFGMDSNLIDAETIDEFARAAGIMGKVEEITKREICRDLDFEQTLAEWGRIIRELSLETIPYAVHKINIIPVATEHILHFKSRGYKDTMISGGFTISATEVCKALNNNFVVTNELLVEDSYIKGKVVGSVTQSNPRGAFEELTLFSRIRPERGVVVEESANNTHLFERAVFAVAFNPKYINKGVCGCGHCRKDLKAIIPVLKSLSYQFCNQAQNVDI